ncbi:MAG: DUF935 family protein [Psychroserpens sp.]|uniref:phage portal protein family protein n=1 Tax=Psychroserpens sp. TaxID=2020870 RepID=UPI003CB027A7
MSKDKKATMPNIESEINFSGNALKKAVSLSSSDQKKIKKITNVMVDVIRRQRRLWRMEVSNWQHGRFARYNSDIPRTFPMQEVNDDVMLDGHLTGITENRTLRTTNKDYIFSIDGKKDDTLTELIKAKKWFEYLIEHAHKSTYYGYSLIWVEAFKKGEILKLQLIPRGLVIPEHNVLLYDLSAVNGIDYSEIKDVLLYAQFYDHIGLLEKAAPFAILKRHSWGSWDEFEELFGVPIRIAKIASSSETVKNEVAEWLEEMGSAAYGVFPTGTEVDIVENSKQDAFNVFYKKIEALDKEMSKLVLHQTMTTENGSSKAQGGVHENTLGEIVAADEKRMLAFLNDDLVPCMRKLGYNIPENAKITVEATKDPTEQIKIDGEFMRNGYILKQSYIEDVYGTEIESMPSTKDPEPTGKD